MARQKDRDDITEDQERRVWEMRRTGATQQRIADELKIDQSTVSRMIKRMTTKLKMEFVDREEEIKITQTAVLEHIADQALQAWNKSKENAQVKRKQVKAEGAKTQKPEEERDLTEDEIRGMYLRPTDAGEYEEEENPEAYADAQRADSDNGGLLIITEVKTATESKGQTGDAALLQAARGALSDIRTIWGVDAPKKQELSGPNGKPIEINDAATQKATEDLNEWRKQMMEGLKSISNVPPT